MTFNESVYKNNNSDSKKKFDPRNKVNVNANTFSSFMIV